MFPAKPFQVALYLSYLVKTTKTSAPIEEAVNSLSWAHTLAVVEDPTDHPLVKQVVAGAKRILAHKTCKKEPITAEILHKLYDRFVSKEAELPIIRTMTICLLGYAGFFRFNELASLKESDVKFYEDHVEVFVESSKTDQYREGAWVPIARTGSKNCPVAIQCWNVTGIWGKGHVCFVRVKVLGAVTQVMSESVILNEVITLTSKVSVVYTIHLVSLNALTTAKNAV